MFYHPWTASKEVDDLFSCDIERDIHDLDDSRSHCLGRYCGVDKWNSSSNCDGLHGRYMADPSDTLSTINQHQCDQVIS